MKVISLMVICWYNQKQLRNRCDCDREGKLSWAVTHIQTEIVSKDTGPVARIQYEHEHGSFNYSCKLLKECKLYVLSIIYMFWFMQ